MFILDDERKRTYMAKQCLYYLAASLFLAVFGRIYEHFSHEVYSWYMMYAFLLPLAGGALPALILSLYGRGPFPGWLPQQLWASGVAALAIGSIFAGVLEIYGTTHYLLRVYWIAGGIFLLMAVLTGAVGFRQKPG